jgi:hypothetical protein
MLGSSSSASAVNTTLEFSDTVMNTTSREQSQADVEDRAAILSKIDTQPIVMAISISKKLQFPFEEVFRS